MLEYIPLALASLKNAKDISSSLLELRDFQKYATKLIELQNHIIKANSMVLSEQDARFLMASKIQELENECMRLKDWSADKEKYVRRNIGFGNFAYVEICHKGELQEAHKLCCNCFDKTVKSTLQQTYGHSRSIILTCPNGCPSLEFYYYMDQGTQ
jgi:hypothetical protein